MRNKDFNKGVTLTAFGSFWWGVIGVIYFQYISLDTLELPRIDNYKWIEKSNLKSAALPSPIRKILNSFESV